MYKIPKTFIGFLLASVLIWFLITLSKEYVTTIYFPIKYSKISQNKLLQRVATKKLGIVVKTSGFKILKTKINTKKIEISTSILINKKGVKHYLLVKNQKLSIQRQLPFSVDLQEIVEDSLFLDVESLVSRKLKIKPNVKITYHVGHDLSEKLKITPDSLLVSGPENYISKIKYIELEPIELEDVKTDFTRKGIIKVSEDIKNLKFEEKEVLISGKVEKFTEGTLNIEYKIINAPEGVLINTLTKEVKITFIVGLSSFNEITKNSFHIECDYSVSKANNLSYLVPKLVHKPIEVKSYKITPKKIDFLIQN